MTAAVGLPVRVPGAALRDRLDTVMALAAVAAEHDIGWPEALNLYPSGIAVLTCATQADAWAWLAFFGDPGERRSGVGNLRVIRWRGWHVQVWFPVPVAAAGGAS